MKGAVLASPAEMKGCQMGYAIVFSVEKFATHDGPGIRTVVFLKGCPLRCKWCHSPESWSFEVERYPDGEVIGQKMSSNEVLAEVLKDKDFYDVSGGEPLAQPAFLVELLRKTKVAGLHTAVETIGGVSHSFSAAPARRELNIGSRYGVFSGVNPVRVKVSVK